MRSFISAILITLIFTTTAIADGYNQRMPDGSYSNSDGTYNQRIPDGSYSQ
jgi:hypothetical protein